MENLNPTQLKILSALLFKPRARFRDLNTEFSGTDLFSYHVRTLVQSGLIKKESSLYSLTAKGKIVAGGIDTSTKTMEKQPKIGVLLIPIKQEGGKKKYLTQRRSKEPFYGYYGFIAGKMRLGETVEETAKRELMEEDGLTGKVDHSYVLHDLVYSRSTGELLDDKFLNIVVMTDLGGALLEETEEGVNKFIELKDFEHLSPKFWDLENMIKRSKAKNMRFQETKSYVEAL